MRINNTAIIVAAGNSTRMGKSGNKIFLMIGAKPTLAHAMTRYELAAGITDIIVVTRPEYFDTVRELAKTYNINKFRNCVAGGATRQLSVYRGVLAAKDADIVSIADGARPFTDPKDIDRVSAAAEKDGGAVLCVAVTDTVKQTENGKIVSTPPRETLLQAQTPQSFRRSLILPLMEKAIAENVAVTDDSSVLEYYGHAVTPVIGNYNNIKITTEQDLVIAEQIIRKEKTK